MREGRISLLTIAEMATTPITASVSPAKKNVSAIVSERGAGPSWANTEATAAPWSRPNANAMGVRCGGEGPMRFSTET